MRYWRSLPIRERELKHFAPCAQVWATKSLPMRKLGITGTDRAPFVSADWHDSPEKSRALAYNARSFLALNGVWYSP